MSQRIGGQPKSIGKRGQTNERLPPRPEPLVGRDTSADGVIGVMYGAPVNAEAWHRKVIADCERWQQNNPGVPLMQARRR